jgi:homocysteine S-methyltransferase
MPRPLDALIAAQPVVILDGALATELQRRGADLNDELWSAKCLIEQPQLIRAVHRDYLEAGADVVTTATYQATFQGFSRRGISRQAAAELLRDAVALAVSARDEFWARLCAEDSSGNRQRPLVAASVGPYGALLADGSEYRGHYAVSEAELAEFHLPRLDVLANCGPDLLAFETIPCLAEALVLARLLERYPHMSAWVSFSCRDDLHNAQGEDVAPCAAALDSHPQIAALGVNCSRPDNIGPLLRRMRARTGKPLLAYPNSGEDYDSTTKAWRGHAQQKPFAEQSLEWYAAGARILGGCCRTTPADIGALRSLHLGPV